MTDFSHLKKLDISDQTARLILYQVWGEPVLIMRSAMQSNSDYTNAVLKKSSRTQQRRLMRGKLSSQLLDEVRDQDRELYAKYVIADWEGVQDAKGKDVKFSVESCEAFLRALPNYVVDDIKEFANNPTNFINDDGILEVQEVSKN